MKRPWNIISPPVYSLVTCDEQGKVNMNLDYELENFYYSENKNSKYNSTKSFSTNDFDINFVRGLSLEDGAATLTQYTVEVILDYIKNKMSSIID